MYLRIGFVICRTLCVAILMLLKQIFQVGIPAFLSIYFDLFSGFVQAFVFCLLTMVYVGAACPPPEELLAEKQAKLEKKALKKEIERLEADLSEAYKKINDLHFVSRKYEDDIKRLRDDLAAEREKYAALLEKYIAMMEKAAKLNEQAIAPESEIVERIFCDIEGMLLKWYYENAYDAQLDSGLKELRNKYMGR